EGRRSFRGLRVRLPAVEGRLAPHLPVLRPLNGRTTEEERRKESGEEDRTRNTRNTRKRSSDDWFCPFGSRSVPFVHFVSFVFENPAVYSLVRSGSSFAGRGLQQFREAPELDDLIGARGEGLAVVRDGHGADGRRAAGLEVRAAGPRGDVQEGDAVVSGGGQGPT